MNNLEMSRNNSTCFYALPFLMLFGLVTCKQSSEIKEEKTKPNFIIIYTDDQQFNGVGYNNPLIKTPNIDRIAAQGIKFSNAHVAFSLCSPSRAALLTGRYGSHNGVLDFTSKNKLDEDEVILPTFLKEKGYVTGLSGKWHIKQAPQALGFDFASYFKGNGKYYKRKYFHNGDTLFPEQHVDEFGVEKSIEFIDDCLEKEQPFFLFHCPQTPHMNGKLIWDAKEETKQQYKVANMPVPLNHLDNLTNKPEYLKTVRNKTKASDYGYPDSLAIQKHVRDYYSVITELDGFLGKLFEHLEAQNLMENTYIVFMSDNGWQLGDHGFTSKVLPYKTSTHVPLWIVGPDILKDTNTSLVSNIDIFPTILELAQVSIPSNIHGKSLRSILKGNENRVRDYFIYEGLGSYGGSKPNLTVLKDDWRYIATYEDTSLLHQTFSELYHKKKDEIEMNNLANDEIYKVEIAEMDKIIIEFKRNFLNK